MNYPLQILMTSDKVSKMWIWRARTLIDMRGILWYYNGLSNVGQPYLYNLFKTVAFASFLFMQIFSGGNENQNL